MGQFEGIMTISSPVPDSFSEGVGEMPCQNCGKMVLISLPFLGCVFCEDCMRNDSGQYDGMEDFYEPRRLEQ